MIKCSYTQIGDEGSEINILCTKIVKNNLIQITSFVFDLCESWLENLSKEEALESFFPVKYLGSFEHNYSEYLEEFQELLRLLKQNKLIYFEPHFELLLYNIMKVFLELSEEINELSEDVELYKLTSEEKKIIEESANEFIECLNDEDVCDEKCIECGMCKDYAVEHITDINKYSEFIFDDYDFLPENVERYVEYWMEIGDFLDIDEDYLKSYEKLMSRNLKESFYKHLPNLNRKLGSFEHALKICNEFRSLIENNRGYELIYGDDDNARERVIQRLLYVSANYYCKLNNLDLSPETNAGMGPVDFKISYGNDKTVIEIKLTSNPNCIHGYTKQLEQYAITENTENKIFMLVKVGDEERHNNIIINRIRVLESANQKLAKVIVIDATRKNSASKI